MPWKPPWISSTRLWVRETFTNSTVTESRSREVTSAATSAGSPRPPVAPDPGTRAASAPRPAVVRGTGPPQLSSIEGFHHDRVVPLPVMWMHRAEVGLVAAAICARRQATSARDSRNISSG